jgi:hypothetical protein
MKTYIAIMAVSLICHASVAGVVPQDFQTVDELIARVKQEEKEVDEPLILYNTNGIIVGLRLPLACTTDHDLHLLSKIKSLRYLQIGGSFITPNGIPALAECPHLTGLCLVCGGGPKKDLVWALPCLTNLQSLKLAQTSYWTNDAFYLAKMTNLVTLQIDGSCLQTQVEMLALTNLVNLRSLAICGVDKFISNLDANIFSKLDKLTNVVITSDPGLLPEDVWKTPTEK